MPLATVCDRHRVIVLDGERCPDCEREDNARRNRKSRVHGLTSSRWKRRRAAKLRRSPRCELQADERCTGRATTVHVPARYRGNHDACPDGELVSACAHCHGVVDGPRAHASRR